jgi:hypothetical protein
LAEKPVYASAFVMGCGRVVATAQPTHQKTQHMPVTSQKTTPETSKNQFYKLLWTPLIATS